MTKRVAMPLLFLCLSACCWCQLSPKNKPQTNPDRESKDGTSKQLSEVLFATNEDCELYIDGQMKGEVLRSAFRYLNLEPGKYTYKAVSKATQDELTDTFTVTEARPNEVFIDLLYLVDEKIAERESLKKEKELLISQVVINEKIASDEPAAKKISRDAVAETIYSLIANMAQITGGKFIMGNNKAPLKDEAEHNVTINSLLFSKYEVTQHQWETIMGYNPSINRNCPTCPVEMVSWGEAIKFIRKLNVLSNKKFRLPTEAEWEYVARLGGKIEVDTAGGQEKYIQKTAWYYGNANKETHPVGIRQANVAGIFDLMGNVSEWCLDWYANSYKDDFGQINPEGPPLGKEKAIRGGNYKDYQGDRFRPSLRNKKIPTEKSSELGFRLVMEM